MLSRFSSTRSVSAALSRSFATSVVAQQEAVAVPTAPVLDSKDAIRKRHGKQIVTLGVTLAREGRTTYKSNRKTNPLVSNQLKTKFEAEKYAEQMKELRVRFKAEADTKKSQEDAKSVAEFMVHRQKVLAQRSKKRNLSIANVKMHEEYMHHLRNEYQRIKLEKNMDRLNKESIESAYRVDGLRRLKDESHTYITPENIDDHIAMQLDPSRLIVPTIFYNRLGINDEVRYEMHKTVMQELQQMEARRRNLGSIKKHFEFEEHLISDDMYPHVKVSHDWEEYLEERVNEATEIDEKQLAILDDPAFHKYIMSLPIEQAEHVIDTLGTSDSFMRGGRLLGKAKASPLADIGRATTETDIETAAAEFLGSEDSIDEKGVTEEGEDTFDMDRALQAAAPSAGSSKPSRPQSNMEDINALEKQIDNFMK